MDQLLKPSGHYCSCGAPISLGRRKYASHPNTCLNCDPTDRLAAVPIINHKTGNTIEITSQDNARRFNKLQNRIGSIVSSGVRGAAGSTR